MVRCTDRPAMTIAVDLGRKATKKKKKKEPQIFNTQKNIIFLNPPKNIEIQNYEAPKNISKPTHVCKYQSTPTPWA